jgi:predicted permease
MNGWQRLWRRKQLEEQLDKELRFHLEQHTAELIALGAEPEEARRQARLALGGPEQVKEECRDARGTRWLEEAWQDLRYTYRTLRQRPGFTAVALLTLALGIGATTVMFTLVNGVLLKPLSYAQPDRLVVLNEQTSEVTSALFGNLWAFAYPNFLDCRRQSRALDIAAFVFRGGVVSVGNQARYVDGFEVSADLFSVLGASLAGGRAFRPEEDRPGGAPVIIISHGLWRSLYDSNPAAVGRSLVLDEQPYTIVGIARPGFRLEGNGGLEGQDENVFTLLGQDPAPAQQRRDRHPGIQVFARLRPGATLAQAGTELGVIGRQLAASYPASNKDRTFIAQPLRPDVGDVGPTLWLLLGGVGLVLLIACVNTASLLLARAVSRERELAVRVALGASRGRLVRQCLTETAALGLCGGLLGVWLAAMGLRPFVAFWPGNLPRADEVRLDGHVLLFAVAVSVASGLLFGLAPALRAPARDLESSLRATGRTLAGSSRRAHSGFVTAEIALALVLLVAAGMLGRALMRLSHLDPGFDYRNVVSARVALSADVLARPAQIRAAWQEVLQRARRVPGVQAVATVDTVPMREGSNQIGYWTSPSIPPADQQPLALANSVTPDYEKVMGLTLLEGRFIDDSDRSGAEHVVVIDDVLAHRAFGGQNPVGKYLWIPGGSSPFTSGSDAADAARVVGVVGHVRQWGLAGDDQAQVRAQFYYPFAQVPDPLLRRWSELMSITVRTSIPPLEVIEPLRRELRGATAGAPGDQALYQVRTMEQLVSASLARQRFLLLLFGIFAGQALLLACVGIYGVLAYLTGQRVPEFGIRMALGAQGRDVMRLVLRQSLAMISLGVLLGMGGAWAAGRLLVHTVDGMRAAGATTFVFTIPVLVAAALLASFVPARRASRVDPVDALRQQ